MTRRQFVPWADRLESRMLLATTKATTSTVSVAATNSSVPLATLQQRLQRIERLPAFLLSISPGRPLPAEAVTEIQENLILLIGRLGSAPRNGLTAFNQALRGAIRDSSISQNEVLTLEHYFGSNLTAAGANSTIVANMAGALRSIAAADANVPNAGAVVANDYALILQLALAMGKPLPNPAVPRLTPDANSGRPNDNVTSVNPPTFQGNYAAPGAVMQLISTDGTKVYGAGQILDNGHYVITVNTVLSVGTHRFRVRAITQDGVVSLASRGFAIRIISPSKG